MAEFCTHERDGGFCKKIDTYCNLGACPYEDMKEYAPVVHGRWEECDFVESYVHGFWAMLIFRTKAELDQWTGKYSSTPGQCLGRGRRGTNGRQDKNLQI